jgi:hypothetical protein
MEPGTPARGTWPTCGGLALTGPGQPITVAWQYIVIAALMALGVYGFFLLTGFERRLLTRKTGRTAESMYGGYAHSSRKQRRRARKQGGE